MDDPLRMYIVVRRGAVGDLARAGELAGGGAWRARAGVRRGVAARPRPGKVCLRVCNASQWEQVGAEPQCRPDDAVVAGRRAGGPSAARCSSACRR